VQPFIKCKSEELKIIISIQLQNMNEIYKVTFSPSDKHVKEIEKWLKAERKNTGNGFYCNWEIIKSSFDKNELVTISLNNHTVGFATWLLTTNKTARIEIFEIKAKLRNKGIGKKLLFELLNCLEDKDVYVVDLQCAPSSSELFWKHLGFLEFPDTPESYKFNSGGNKKLYKILIEHLQISSKKGINETIELWNNEQYTQNDHTPSTYFWNIVFKDETRKLTKPIIHPAHHTWRLLWSNNGVTVEDKKIKRFNPEIYFENFIIIENLY
jgi:hypothetical protein